MANQQKDDSMSRSDTTAGANMGGQGASPTGGDASSGATPPPTNKGGASAA